jgi:hypothetical protein
MKSHSDRAATGNPPPPEYHALDARGWDGTQNDKGWWAQSVQRTQRGKAEVTMSRALKSFADFSLKVVAVRTADDSAFGFEFPASGPQSTPSPLTAPFEQPAERGRGPLAQYPGWDHGGINE